MQRTGSILVFRTLEKKRKKVCSAACTWNLETCCWTRIRPFKFKSERVDVLINK